MHDGDRNTRFPGSAGTSAAVRVSLYVVGQSVVDDVGQVGNVESAGGNVGGDEQLQVSQSEFLHDGIPLGL